MVSRTEEKGYTPEPGKSYRKVDNSADYAGLSAEQPCDCVELEESYSAPVESSDDCENESQSVKH